MAPTQIWNDIWYNLYLLFGLNASSVRLAAQFKSMLQGSNKYRFRYDERLYTDHLLWTLYYSSAARLHGLNTRETWENPTGPTP